jgi:MYXO-CTERM domain-containing protein
MTPIRPTTLTTIAGALLALMTPAVARATTYYVATTGSDTAAGTMAAPFGSWARAQTAAVAGDTVYFRGGTYRYTSATSTCNGSTSATVNAVVLSKSGASGSPINYWAYPGETPVFDFSGITDPASYNCRQVGVRVEADWLYLKGLELKGTLQLNSDNHESWCVYVIGGNNNKFERLDAHHNMGPGFFLQAGGNNTFLNCDSHENEDTLTSNGDGQSADGFGCHPSKPGNTGNLFHGCRAWWNSDDGWDFINAQEACTVEYSWAWYGGYKPDAIAGGAPVPLSAGNGNGFKAGGYGDPQAAVPATPPQHVVRFNVAFYNKANGIYANHGIVSPYIYDNTSFNNGVDVSMLGLDGTTVTSVGMLRNNLAFGHTLTADLANGGPISDLYNSWDSSLGVTVTNADFESVAMTPPASCPQAYTPGGTACCPPTDLTCFAGMASARQADGSLPVLPFLRLAPGSDLIDKGTNLGFPFNGKAPDLGAFESGAASTTGGGGSGGGVAGAAGAAGTSGAAGGGGAGASGSPGAGGTSGGPGAGGSEAAPGGSGGPAAGGAGGQAAGAGGQTASGGPDASTTGSDAPGGCACETGGGGRGGGGALTALAMVGLLVAAARRRRATRGAAPQRAR